MLASTMPILGFGYLESWRWREASTEMVKERVLTKAEAVTNEVRRIIEIRLSAFEVLAEQIRLQNARSPLKPQQLEPLMKFYAEQFDLVSVGFADMNGKLLAYYHPDPVTRAKVSKFNVKNNGFIDVIEKTRASVVTSLRRARTSVRNLFYLASPVWDSKKQNIVATVGSGIAPSEIRAIADRIMASSPLLTYQILDENGVMVAGTGVDNLARPLTRTETQIYSPAPSKLPEIRQGRDENGNEVYAAVQPLHLRNANWTVIISEDKARVLQNEREAWHQMTLLIAGALVASFILASLISYLISQPIIRLIEGMQLIRSGQYEKWNQLSKQERSGFKEIHAAWQALMTMAKRLHEYTINLEGLVSQRTRELDDQRARAVESARLAALGEMAGGIAHEINNPLSIIYLVAEQQQSLHKQGKSDPVKTQDAFRVIADTTQRIVKIITGLKTFSRDGINDPVETIEVRTLLEHTLTFCQQKFKNRFIGFTVTYDHPDLAISCRQVQISQVILNVLNNAFDAVESANEKWIKINVVRSAGNVEIQISDSGAGVPEQYREKIFQPFFTLKEVGKGTGLGLSISRSIIESQGGRIALDITRKHTTFVIYLPLVMRSVAPETSTFTQA